MERLQEWLAHVPRTVLVLIGLVVAGLLIQWRFRSSRRSTAAIDEATFKARPALPLAFAALCLVFLWPVIFGLGQPPHLSHGLNTVLPPLPFLGMATLFAFLVFTLRRSYVRITPDVVEYYDGWRKRRCIPRSDIISADVRYPGAILVVQCADKANNFSISLLAYSRAGLLAALLQGKA